MVGFCTNREIIEGTRRSFYVCNEDSTAISCPQYRNINTEATIRQEMADIIKDPCRCGKEYPKLAMLLWVLQNPQLPKR